MDLFGDKKEEQNFHKLNENNYRIWKFQINAYMRSQGLMNNVEGKEPAATASEKEKQEYDCKEGKAMNAVIQSLDSERANFVLTYC